MPIMARRVSARPHGDGKNNVNIVQLIIPIL